jgi:hypothetical protein
MANTEQFADADFQKHQNAFGYPDPFRPDNPNSKQEQNKFNSYLDMDAENEFLQDSNHRLFEQ